MYMFRPRLPLGDICCLEAFFQTTFHGIDYLLFAPRLHAEVNVVEAKSIEYY